MHSAILARRSVRPTIVPPNPLDRRSDDEQVPTAKEITRHHDDDPDENPWVNGPPPAQIVEIVPYNDDWPRRFDALATGVRDVLGDTALAVEHVGSTSVPGLAAKDVI